MKGDRVVRPAGWGRTVCSCLDNSRGRQCIWDRVEGGVPVDTLGSVWKAGVWGRLWLGLRVTWTQAAAESLQWRRNASIGERRHPGLWRRNRMVT